MLLSRFSSLRKKLLTQVGPGGSEAAPLRAYGKLGLDAEYLRVGCDDQPAASAFASWLDQGNDRCVRLFGKDAFHVRQHRMMISSDRGRVWLVACVWHSGDRVSDQGHRRVFPFSLFVVVPAPDKPSDLTAMPRICAPIWFEMERLYPILASLENRTVFSSRVKNEALLAPPREATMGIDDLAEAKHIRLIDWYTYALGSVNRGDDLLLGLQHSLLEFRRSHGELPHAWRFPTASHLDVGVQVSCWLHWLETNARQTGQTHTVLIPSEGCDRGCDITVFRRELTPDDLTLLLSNPSQIDGSVCRRLADGAVLPEGHEGFLQLTRRELPDASATLVDLVRNEFQRPASV